MNAVCSVFPKCALFTENLLFRIYRRCKKVKKWLVYRFQTLSLISRVSSPLLSVNFESQKWNHCETAATLSLPLPLPRFSGRHFSGLKIPKLVILNHQYVFMCLFMYLSFQSVMVVITIFIWIAKGLSWT